MPATPYPSPRAPAVVAQELTCDLRDLGDAHTADQVIWYDETPKRALHDTGAGFYRYPTGAETCVFLGDRPRLARRAVRQIRKAAGVGMSKATKDRLRDLSLDAAEETLPAAIKLLFALLPGLLKKG